MTRRTVRRLRLAFGVLMTLIAAPLWLSGDFCMAIPFSGAAGWAFAGD